MRVCAKSDVARLFPPVALFGQSVIACCVALQRETIRDRDKKKETELVFFNFKSIILLLNHYNSLVFSPLTTGVHCALCIQSFGEAVVDYYICQDYSRQSAYMNCSSV